MRVYANNMSPEFPGIMGIPTQDIYLWFLAYRSCQEAKVAAHKKRKRTGVKKAPPCHEGVQQ